MQKVLPKQGWGSNQKKRLDEALSICLYLFFLSVCVGLFVFLCYPQITILCVWRAHYCTKNDGGGIQARRYGNEMMMMVMMVMGMEGRRRVSKEGEGRGMMMMMMVMKRRYRGWS